MNNNENMSNQQMNQGINNNVELNSNNIGTAQNVIVHPVEENITNQTMAMPEPIMPNAVEVPNVVANTTNRSENTSAPVPTILDPNIQVQTMNEGPVISPVQPVLNNEPLNNDPISMTSDVATQVAPVVAPEPAPVINNDIPNPNSVAAQVIKKNNNTLWIIIIFVLLMIIAVLAYFLFNCKSAQCNTSPVNNVQNNAEQNTDQPNQSSSKNKTAFTDDNWYNLEFMFDNKIYTLNDYYSLFESNGWHIDLEKTGYRNGYILNQNDKIASILDLLNDEYTDSDVNVGFINLDETAKDITKCQIWAISVDNGYSDTPVNFELPGNVKYHSTIEDVEKAYGKTDDTYRSEELKYTTYHYRMELEKGEIELDLTIYDEKGLTAFDYKIY